MALILQAMCLMNKKQQAFHSSKRSLNFYRLINGLSTQTTAYGLLAISDFIKKYGGSSAMQAKCSVNGKEIMLAGKVLFLRFLWSLREVQAAILQFRIMVEVFSMYGASVGVSQLLGKKWLLQRI